MKNIIKRLFSSFGLSITKLSNYIPPDGLLLNPENQKYFDETVQTIRKYSMCSRDRLALLFELVQHVNQFKINGCIVECGVWKGGAAGVLASACQKFSKIRDIKLFDCFDDICEPDANVDGERAIREAGGLDNAQGRLKPIKGVYDYVGGHGTIDICKDLLVNEIHYPADKISFYKGWFQETMQNRVPEIQDIAILHIDADWYSSTKVSLDTFYDRIQIGGAIVIDDYGAYDGCRKAVDEFCQSRNLTHFRNHVDHECIYWFKD